MRQWRPAISRLVFTSPPFHETACKQWAKCGDMVEATVCHVCSTSYAKAGRGHPGASPPCRWHELLAPRPSTSSWCIRPAGGLLWPSSCCAGGAPVTRGVTCRHCRPCSALATAPTGGNWHIAFCRCGASVTRVVTSGLGLAGLMVRPSRGWSSVGTACLALR